MSSEQNIPPSDERRQANHEAWQEVGRQFQQLGESLAQAVRTAWNDEENRRRVQEMQGGLEAMVEDVGKAIRDTAKSPEGQQFQANAKRTADQLVSTGEQTIQEIRPHIVNALTQLNQELQKLVNHMEQEDKKSNPPEENK
jgi:hypothetical protein